MRKSDRAVTGIEVMITIVVLLVIGAFVVRIAFARQVRDWEDALWRSLGVEPGLGRLGAAVLVLALAATRAVLRWRKRLQRGGA